MLICSLGSEILSVQSYRCLQWQFRRYSIVSISVINWRILWKIIIIMNADTEHANVIHFVYQNTNLGIQFDFLPTQLMKKTQKQKIQNSGKLNCSFLILGCIRTGTYSIKQKKTKQKTKTRIYLNFYAIRFPYIIPKYPHLSLLSVSFFRPHFFLIIVLMFVRLSTFSECIILIHCFYFDSTQRSSQQAQRQQPLMTLDSSGTHTSYVTWHHDTYALIKHTFLRRWTLLLINQQSNIPHIYSYNNISIVFNVIVFENCLKISKLKRIMYSLIFKMIHLIHWLGYILHFFEKQKITLKSNHKSYEQWMNIYCKWIWQYESIGWYLTMYLLHFIFVLRRKETRGSAEVVVVEEYSENNHRCSIVFPWKIDYNWLHWFISSDWSNIYASYKKQTETSHFSIM